jgi:magnesium transporter
LSPAVTPEDLRDAWPLLDAEERVAGFQGLDRSEAPDFFQSLSSRAQAQVLLGCTPTERTLWARLLAPDDAVDVLQEIPREGWQGILDVLDPPTRREVNALLAYEEDEAGGLMSPRFVRARPDMSVDEAIRYVRRQAGERAVETIYYVYVLDAHQRLEGVVSFRELLISAGDRPLREIMHTELVSVRDDWPAEAVAKVVAREDLLAVPVIDAEGHMRGIVTIDDVVDVVEEEATEDIQKLGGMEAFDMPYMQTSFLPMLKKRAGWLAVLFLGELLTASAMARFEDEIARAVVLTLFVPLIISSGGNSGSQAATLVIRALALGEVKLRDWWRVVRREFAAGLVLGAILAILGVLRITLAEYAFGAYGEQAARLAITVGVSLLCVVTLGTLSGSILPLLLRRLGLDPASASAPFVATIVDVSGLAIYFSVAALVLPGASGV